MPSSTSFVVISTVDVKDWIEKVPSVDRLRPNRCPCCGGASRPVGKALKIWGHGVRSRLLWGVWSLGQLPAAVTIDARRFLCRRPDCGRTFTVLPRQAIAGRRYVLPTIVLALALWVLDENMPSTAQIRRRLSPDKILDHHTPWTSWPQLFRWTEADDLMSAGISKGLNRRQKAEYIAQSFAGRSPPSTRYRPLVERAFVGADSQNR